MILPLVERGVIGLELRKSCVENFESARLLFYRRASGIRLDD
jgi:hypothetical protein